MRLFVCNLRFTFNDQDLRKLFEPFGFVANCCYVVTDRETGNSRGFGFVEMPDEKEAAAAIEALDGRELQGRLIGVRESQETRPRTREAANR